MIQKNAFSQHNLRFLGLLIWKWSITTFFFISVMYVRVVFDINWKLIIRQLLLHILKKEVRLSALRSLLEFIYIQ